MVCCPLLLRFPVDSPPETLLRLEIVKRGFDEPVVDCPIPVAGRTLHADLGYPELKIAIEYEGAYHFDDGPEQARWDAERWEDMRDAGWRVLRVQASTMRDLRRFFERLRNAITDQLSIAAHAERRYIVARHDQPTVSPNQRHVQRPS